ncbi:MAG: ACT domain-containing protein, partial [Rhodococcus sp. (in: high G+C Gram-positive bacteria)]|nr:ACT domain-containing protein [Rhodococcus sp. (in: high G+C Gram-positive bacteria)]MDX5455993.1 ACT domain-containing protein [Rhodococcus sp. (in: high G+C Gram-positive bacteria)]
PGENPHAYTVTVVAPDEPGLLSDAAGVLALHGLRVLSASVGSHAGSAVNSFAVAPLFGAPPAAGLLRQELVRARSGDLDLLATLAAKEQAAREAQLPERPERAVPGTYAQAPPHLIWIDAPEQGQAILELRAEDRLGMLCRLADAFERCGADVRWARVATLGRTVVDAFCIDLAGSDTRENRERIERAVLAVVPAPEPKKPEDNG